jgi:hypothetical protein
VAKYTRLTVIYKEHKESKNKNNYKECFRIVKNIEEGPGCNYLVYATLRSRLRRSRRGLQRLIVDLGY